MRRGVSGAVMMGAGALLAWQCAASAGRPPTGSEALERLARQAAGGEAGAVEAIRRHGPDGLAAFLAVYDEAGTDRAALDPTLDAVCRQRDCAASRLFWHTDLERALAEARASGRPVLSLRLLGRLSEELSCANSRFFRTALYPNAEVSRYLRERFVLHWESVRPAPRISVDFGDGRRLERTVTGNSIHYVLDADGRVIDGLPGLYGPAAFLRELRRAETIARQASALSARARRELLRRYHRARGAALEQALRAELSSAQLAVLPAGLVLVRAADATVKPTASEAGALAMTKLAPEAPLVRAIDDAPIALPRPAPDRDDAIWPRIAEAHRADAALDPASRALMRRKLSAGAGEPLSDERLARTVEAFERLMALDTARNEHLLHRTLHEWLAAEPASDVRQLNERVYAELFLTPGSDPWLGLVPEDAYAALDGNGLHITDDTGGDR